MPIVNVLAADRGDQIGLGYVGLPLVLGFSKASRAIGLDISESKIKELRRGIDFTGEVHGDELQASDAEFTSDPRMLQKADVIIVCVPPRSTVTTGRIMARCWRRRARSART